MKYIHICAQVAYDEVNLFVQAFSISMQYMLGFRSLRMGCPEPDDGVPGENRMTKARWRPEETCVPGKDWKVQARKVPDYTGPVRNTHRMEGHICIVCF